MQFAQSDLHNFLDIARFIHSNPPLDVLMAFLATRVCPTGEIAKVYLGRLDHDGIFRTAATFGYSNDSSAQNYEIPITANRPMPHAFRSSRTIIGTRDEIKANYPEVQDLDPSNNWSSIAAVPMTNGGYVFVFLLQNTMEDPEFFEGYFSLIGSLLSFYRIETSRFSSLPGTSDLNEVSKHPQNSQISMKGKPLTERQKRILDLIIEGFTNHQIASRVGFSESLVRQETVIIYSKLGIRGRKDLPELSA